MTADCLSATFSALADPTRRAILARLALGELSVGELARPFKISGPAITKHLKVLQRVGLITRGRRAQWRPCRLEAKPLQEVAAWVEEVLVILRTKVSIVSDRIPGRIAKEGKRGKAWPQKMTSSCKKIHRSKIKP